MKKLYINGKTLSNGENEVPKYGLKHGGATRPPEVEMIIIAGKISSQIAQKGLCNHFMKREIVKAALRRAFTYSYIDIND